MKKISLFLFLGFILSLVSTSCSNTKTFAQQLDDEQALINAYIKRNNINVVTTMPTNNIWAKDGKDIYYKSTSGLYFHLVDSGSRVDTATLQLKGTVIPRYKQYYLTLTPDTISNWSTIDYPYPPEFVYGDMTQSSKAFQEAVWYMRKNGSQAKLIVPFLLGSDVNSSTPYAYILKIQVLK